MTVNKSQGGWPTWRDNVHSLPTVNTFPCSSPAVCVCYLERQLLHLVSSEQESPLRCFHVLVLCICKRESRLSVFLFSFSSEMFVRTLKALAESAWVHIALNIVSAALALKEESIVPKDTEALRWELAVGMPHSWASYTEAVLSRLECGS